MHLLPPGCKSRFDPQRKRGSKILLPYRVGGSHIVHITMARILRTPYTFVSFKYSVSQCLAAHLVGVPSTGVLDFLAWSCEPCRLDHFSRLSSGFKSRFHPRAKAAGGVSVAG